MSGSGKRISAIVVGEIAIVKTYLQNLPPDDVLKWLEKKSGIRTATIFHAYWTALGQKFTANLKLNTPELTFDNPELEKAINAGRDYYWQLSLTCIQAHEENVFPRGCIDSVGGVGELVKILITEDLLGMANLFAKKQVLTPKVKDFKKLLSLRNKGLKGEYQKPKKLRGTIRGEINESKKLEDGEYLLSTVDPDLLPTLEELNVYWKVNSYVRSLFLTNKTRLKNYKAFCSALKARDQYSYRQVLKQGDEINQKR